MPVSSRGQDTWFSATGPGFESPYRYHQSWLIGFTPDTSRRNRVFFESRRLQRPDVNPDRRAQHFSELLSPVLSPAGERPASFELPSNNGFQGALVDRVFLNLLAVADRPLHLSTPLFAGAEFIEE